MDGEWDDDDDDDDDDDGDNNGLEASIWILFFSKARAEQ